MIYAIADLHLDHTGKKSMEVFGKAWENYQGKIKDYWENVICDDDLVLIPGDISWAMKLEDALKDLNLIESLPGQKILMKGNHDYWWQSLLKINSCQFKTLRFLQNTAYQFGCVGIAGTRAWSNTDLEHEKITEHEKKIFKRELIRLELSLKELTKLKSSFNIAMLHYPPFNRDGKLNEFAALMKEYNINCCIYGHLHGQGHKYIREGFIDGVEFHCVSGDYLSFRPKLIFKEV